MNESAINLTSVQRRHRSIANTNSAISI